MRYTRKSKPDAVSYSLTVRHVKSHLSSVASATDDENEYAHEVLISTRPVPDGIFIEGELNREPQAPYFGVQPRSLLATPPSGLAASIMAELRKAGVNVVTVPGWDRRGNGQSWGSVEGVLMHHTASPHGPAYPMLWQGRSDLPGPLCNSAGEADGTICIVAAHPANHAGSSGGNSMGPLPTTRTFNKRVWGHEIVYPGSKPMTDAQYRSAVILGRVITRILGGTAERVRGHAETSVTGKWDPGYAMGKTIDMNRFRADVSSQEDELSQQFESDARKWFAEYKAKYDLMERDLRADLAAKAREISALRADVSSIRNMLAELLTSKPAPKNE